MGLPRGPWVITRELEDAAPIIAALAARGHQAVAMPAIERARLPWPPAFNDAAADGAWFFCTSPFAARCTLDALGARAAQARFLATAPATAQVLRERGMAVEIMAPGGTVELARAALAAGISGRVLYPTSDAGLAQAEQQEAAALLAATCDVTRAAVYTTRPARGLDEAVARLPRPWRAVLFSPSAARALADAVTHAGGNPPELIVAVGASTQRALALPCVRAPRDRDLVDFLCSVDDSSHAPEVIP